MYTFYYLLTKTTTEIYDNFLLLSFLSDQRYYYSVVLSRFSPISRIFERLIFPQPKFRCSNITPFNKDDGPVPCISQNIHIRALSQI